MFYAIVRGMLVFATSRKELAQKVKALREG